MSTRPQPSHVKIELDKEVLSRVVRELGLRRPPKFILNGAGVEGTNGKAIKFLGAYHPRTNTVSVTSQFGHLQRARLIEATKEVKFTVLHELRHAWQRENWSAEYQLEAAKGPYAQRIEELDANAWAAYAAPKFAGLVRITRRPVGGKTGFGRMTERSGG